ncbi:MAG TPA: PEGA domain-containing protein [Blastocatellia bacterium]|nr:PEGA domain-containing protein [Blastocatellia bacterium]
MKTPGYLALSLICLFVTPGYSLNKQDQQGSPPNTQSADKLPSRTEPQPPRPALAFGLEDGTPVRMRVNRTVSSADAKVNDRVDFEVLDEVKVKDVVVIARGGIAWATVTDALPKRRMGRAGKLNINIDAVRLESGEKAALRAVKEVKGGSHTGAMTGAMVATSIVFFPAAPLFLFMHGKDITIPKGTEITAYVNGDTPLDPSKFTAASAQPAQTVAADASSATPAGAKDAGRPASDLSVVNVRSTPDGADITVDGKFVGDTPSTLRLSTGDHVILIEKAGFKPWQKTISINPSSDVKIDATLEKVLPSGPGELNREQQPD